MSKGQRTLATLLAIIAALLAAHLLVRLGDQEAHAQNGPPFDSAAPTVVGVTMADVDHAGSTTYRIIRAWSDGSVDSTSVEFIHDVCEIIGTPCTASVIPPP